MFKIPTNISTDSFPSQTPWFTNKFQLLSHSFKLRVWFFNSSNHFPIFLLAWFLIDEVKREVSRCNRIIKAASQHLISHRVSSLMMLETGRLISMWGAGCHLPGGAAGHWNNGVMTRHHQRVPVWSISLDDRSIQRFSICWPLSLSFSPLLKDFLFLALFPPLVHRLCTRYIYICIP